VPAYVSLMSAKGVIVGLVASWVKALTEPRLQALAEAILPPAPSQKQDVGADPSGHPENMPPAVLVDRAAVAFGRRPTVPQRLRAQQVIHYGMGTGLGVAYSAAAGRWPAASRARGALAGVAIYAGTHGSLLPALGIQRPPWRLAPAAVAWESTSHIVFGVALEAARSALGGRR
jgi:putative membrane protein